MLHDPALDFDTANSIMADSGIDEYEPEPTQAVAVATAGDFDVLGFAQRYGIEIHRTTTSNGETKHVLAECVFDSNHKAPDAAIFQKASGQLGYKCFHNSCQGKSWRDVREKFEPGYRDRQSSTSQQANGRAAKQPIKILSASAFIAAHPNQAEPIIEGLLRRGETMNHIAATKVGKSWNVLALALTMATGGYWLGRRVVQGNVLLIDNELMPAGLAHRIKLVADAMGLEPGTYDSLTPVSLRGKLRGIDQLHDLFEQFPAGHIDMIILDAVYRAIPTGAKENDNDTWRDLYNLVDRYSQRMNAAFVLVHHSSKGFQSDKATTDVGAGGGAMSRATDTHLILREHEEEGAIVVDAAVRSFPPVESFCMRWDFPLWHVEEELDPSDMKRAKAARADKGKQHEDLVASYQEKIIAALISLPGNQGTETKVKKHTGNGGRAFNDAMAHLLRVGRVETCELSHPGNGKPLDGFRLANNEG